MAMMAYAVLGRGMLSAEVPKVAEMAADDIRARLPFASSSAAHRHCYQRTELEQGALRPEPAASRRLSCPSTRPRP